MLNILREMIARRCEDWGGELIEFNGEADQLLDLSPNLDLSRRQQRKDHKARGCIGEILASTCGACIASLCSIAPSPAVAHHRR